MFYLQRERLMNTELARQQPTSIKQWLQSDELKGQVAAALPRHMRPDRVMRVALNALTRVPKLADCTPQSVCRCLLDLSSMGLEPDGRRAHLIPYGKECTLVVDYKGLVELAYRSGEIAMIHADIFCDGEVFDESLGQVIAHKIDRSKPRGKPLGAYCIVRFKNGSEKHEVLGVHEIEAVRKRSRAGQSGPWVTDWAEMAKKTAFRRCSKWLPLASEVLDAFEKEDVHQVIEATATRKTATSLAALTEQLTSPTYDTIDSVVEALNQANDKAGIVAISKAAMAAKPDDSEWVDAVDRLAQERIESL